MHEIARDQSLAGDSGVSDREQLLMAALPAMVLESPTDRERREAAVSPLGGRPRQAGFGPQSVLALQRTAGNQAVARLLQRSTPAAPAPAPAPAAPGPSTDLLAAFAGKFPLAAEKIALNAAALRFVEEAARQSAQFGGYSEEGPVKCTTPYTYENRVYVAQAQTDPLRAMGDFLFELSNAAHATELGQVERDARAGTIDAKTFARRKIEVEVEGILSTGAIWHDWKGGNHNLDGYDKHFFAEEHEAFKSGAKTKDQIVDDVLQWRNINAASMTNERWYMQQYDKLRSGEPQAPEAP